MTVLEAFASNVQPRRRVLPAATEPWECGCITATCCGLGFESGVCCLEPNMERRMHAPTHLNCPDCGARRPRG